MKHTLLALLLGFSCLHGNCQFKSLLNKVKDKVNSKLNGNKPDSTHTDTATAKAAGTNGATAPAGASGATGDAAANASNADAKTMGNHAPPQPPVFPVTGKKVKVTTASFAVDTEEDWNNLLKNPVVQDLISRLRQRGVTGTDKEVLTKAMQNQDAYADIQADMRAKYGNAAISYKPGPALVFAAFLSSYDYVMSPAYIRAEIGKTDSTGGQGGFAGALANGFAPGITTIIDINAKKSYTVANFLNILPAAIVEDLSSFQDAFGLSAYFRKYLHQPEIRMQALGHTNFHGYSANVVGVEVPVTPVTDDNGKQSDGLLYLHSLLSGNTGDLATKHYDPSYKLYVETYYSHDLDAMIPSPITADKNILHVDGFYVGSVLKDEKGNKVVYALQHIDSDRYLDEGMFLIPDGYEKMTNAQFKEKLREKLRGGK